MGVTQYEQENDLGGGAGGQVDEETLEQAWQTGAKRRSTANEGDPEAGEREAAGQQDVSSPD